MKYLNLTLIALLLSVISFAQAPAPVTGPSTLCVSGTGTFADDSSGGTWSSDATLIATVDMTLGTVTALSPGMANISYATIGGTVTVALTVNPVPYAYPMSGDGIACSGGAGVDISLLGSTPGISYQLVLGGSPVGLPIAGTGVPLDFGSYSAGGTYTIVGMDMSSGCSSAMLGSATITAAFSPNPYAVTGGGAICAGGAGLDIALAATDPGINYQLYRGTATVGAPVTGTGATLDFGTTTTAGTYTIVAVDTNTGCSANMSGAATITVNPLPVAFTVGGGGAYCSGTSGLNITISGSVAGTNYQLLEGGVVAGAPIPGTGSSISFGLHTTGTYTVVATIVATGCTRTMTGSAVVSAVMLTPGVSIVSTPGGTVCTGTTVTYGAAASNGGLTPAFVWSVNGAVVTSTGTTYSYVPVNNDVITVKLTSSLPCAAPDSAMTSDTMTVIIPVITASSSSICGGTDFLVAHGGVSYTWAPSTGLSCTTCDTVSVDPLSTIVYTLARTDAYGCIGTTTITADGNRISGHISITGAPGSIRVWLIQFNSADSSLVAVDSTMACLDGGTPYYAFNDKPTGNYLVKASQLGGTAGVSGYIPTYGVSSSHWDAATGLLHGTGTDTMHINMLYGIVSPGPGFISGFVLSGAGRNTTTNAPVAGLLIYLTESVSGNILTYTYTNSAGYYAFSNLANGSYQVYPELFHYYTTPAYVVTLTTLNELVYNIDFKQHTTYGVILPYLINEQVNPISAENGINVFPNPTTGSVNIQWNNQQTGIANIVVTDVLGRETFNSIFDMNAAAGETQMDLNALKNGIYMITIKSPGANYTGKLMIQR